MEPYFELLDGIGDATASDAEPIEIERKPTQNLLWEKASSFFGFRRSQRAGGDDDGEGGGRARDDKEPPKQGAPITYIGAINFEKSEVEPHKQGRTDIECWTFTVFDHRPCLSGACYHQLDFI